MASPPSRRLRSTTAHEQDLDAIVDAVVARLTGAGLVAAAEASAAPVQPKAEDEEIIVTDGATGPVPAQQQLWLADLREQLTASCNFGTREREEVRGLLIIGEGAGPPPVHQHWFWGRVRLFLIVAHEGWATAVSDARHGDMTRLGIHLSPAARRPADRAGTRLTPGPPAERRPRPSRPSGLRAPSGLGRRLRLGGGQRSRCSTPTPRRLRSPLQPLPLGARPADGAGRRWRRGPSSALLSAPSVVV